MARTHRLSTTAALIICLIATQWSGTLFASEEESSSRSTLSTPSVADSTTEVPGATLAAGTPDLARSTMERPRFAFSNEVFTAKGPLGADSEHWLGTLTFAPVESSAFAQRRGYRGRGRGGHSGSAAAMVLGAGAAIAGAAVLVYANRPDCRPSQTTNGCGYGTKVIGGAVLSAGVVGLVAGALTW